MGDDDAFAKYSQFNPGTAGAGTHYLNAFRPDQTLWLIGIDVATGKVVLEHQRTPPSADISPNFVDIAFWSGV